MRTPPSFCLCETSGEMTLTTTRSLPITESAPRVMSDSSRTTRYVGVSSPISRSTS